MKDKERVSLYIVPAIYKRVKKHIKNSGMSMNQFFIVAATEKMAREMDK